jgi:hypothetical protein
MQEARILRFGAVAYHPPDLAPMELLITALARMTGSTQPVGLVPARSSAILASNCAPVVQEHEDEPNEWLEPDAMGDVTFAGGLLGLFVAAVAVLRLTGHRFPDTLFWHAVPLLLTLPPGLFLAALCAPGGLQQCAARERAHAARLALTGLLSYVAPLVLLPLVASLASWR